MTISCRSGPTRSATIIQKILDALADGALIPYADRAIEHAAIVESLGDQPFFIDGVPVFLFNEVAASMGEEFDASERAGLLGVRARLRLGPSHGGFQSTWTSTSTTLWR